MSETPTTAPAAEAKLPAVAQIKMGENGKFLPQTFDDAFRLARMYVASGMLPKRYQTPESVVTAQQYAAELGLTAGITALRQIAVVNGTPALFGDLPLALVRSKGSLEMIDEYLVTKDGTKICLENKNISAEFYAAVCTVKRKGEPERTNVFTVDDAKTAGLWGQNVWKPYPKRMIQMRTRGGVLKDVWADVLAGIAMGEYDLNTVIEDVESSVANPPANGGAAALNNLAAAKQPEVLPPENPAPKPSPKAAPKAPAAAAPEPSQDSFASFSETQVKHESAPIQPVTRDELANWIGIELARLNLPIEGLAERCLKEFNKQPDALDANEMQVILTVLKKQPTPEKGKKTA